MATQQTKTTHHTKTDSAKLHQEVSFSPATIAVAKQELQKSELQSDKAFLIRAEMDKKLGSF